MMILKLNNLFQMKKYKIFILVYKILVNRQKSIKIFKKNKVNNINLNL